MKDFLRHTNTIDWHHPGIKSKARELKSGKKTDTQIVKACFEWVRDDIRHIHDYDLQTVSCTASEVLASGSGICYAKSHLLAALLRANLIPAGFCYQRLSRDDNGPPYCLHGLNAVHLSGFGWYRIDARGNKEGVDARFSPPVEYLAFECRLAGETTFPEIMPDPLNIVIKALKQYIAKDDLWDHLPDTEALESTGDAHAPKVTALP